MIVVVFNDASLSLIAIKQQARRLPAAGVALGDDRLGGAGREHRRQRHLPPRTRCRSSGRSIRRRRRSGPSVIDARIDGSNYGAMLTACGAALAVA